MEKTKWGIKYTTSRLSFILNYIGAMLLFVFLFTAWGFLAKEPFFFKLISSFCMVFILFLVLEPEIKIRNEEYFITDDEVAIIRKFWKKKSIHIPYHSITKVEFKKPFVGKILNFGNVSILSSEGKVEMRKVEDPAEITKIIEFKMKQKGEIGKPIEEKEEKKEEKIEEKLKKIEEKKKEKGLLKGFLPKFKF